MASLYVNYAAIRRLAKERKIPFQEVVAKTLLSGGSQESLLNGTTKRLGKQSLQIMAITLGVDISDISSKKEIALPPEPEEPPCPDYVLDVDKIEESVRFNTASLLLRLEKMADNTELILDSRLRAEKTLEAIYSSSNADLSASIDKLTARQEALEAGLDSILNALLRIEKTAKDLHNIFRYERRSK